MLYERYCITAPDVTVYTMGSAEVDYAVTADQVYFYEGADNGVVYSDRDPDGNPVLYPENQNDPALLGQGAYVQNFGDNVIVYGSNIHDALLNYGGLSATLYGNAGLDELDAYSGPGTCGIHPRTERLRNPNAR